MYKKILFILICFFTFSKVVSADTGFYQMSASSIHYGGAFNFSSYGSSSDTNSMIAYQLSPGETSSSILTRINFDYQSAVSGAYYTNVPSLIDYVALSYSNSIYNAGGYYYAPFKVGPGHYNDNPNDSLIDGGDQLQYVYFDMCFSGAGNRIWQTTDIYPYTEDRSYLKIKFLGVFINDINGIANTCTLTRTLDDGTTITIDGEIYRFIYKVNGLHWYTSTFSFDSRIMFSIKNTSTDDGSMGTTLWFRPVGLSTTSDHSGILSYDPTQYMQDLSLLTEFRDFISDYDDTADTMINYWLDQRPYEFNGFLGEWNNFLIQDSSITSMLAIPQNLYNKLHRLYTNQCYPYQLPFHIFNSNYNLTLPCISLTRVLNENVANVIGIILSAYIYYSFIQFTIKWFNSFISLRDSLDFFIQDNPERSED